MRVRPWLTFIAAAGMLGATAHWMRTATHNDLEQQSDQDRASLLATLRDAPLPAPPEVGVLSPYDVHTEYMVVETGGPENAAHEFDEPESGLLIEVRIHTCRPNVMHSRERIGELNLVDGSKQALCTSGGVVDIRDPETGETFRIHFKLVGAPNGSIGWNARQLVSRRNEDESWHETLVALRETLQPRELPWRAETIRVQDDTDTLETYDAADPADALMSGLRSEMMRLLAFRTAFEDFYASPDSYNAERIIWLLVDSLLSSATQEKLSERWIERLNAAGAGSCSRAARSAARRP